MKVTYLSSHTKFLPRNTPSTILGSNKRKLIIFLKKQNMVDFKLGHNGSNIILYF